MEIEVWLRGKEQQKLISTYSLSRPDFASLQLFSALVPWGTWDQPSVNWLKPRIESEVSANSSFFFQLFQFILANTYWVYSVIQVLCWVTKYRKMSIHSLIRSANQEILVKSLLCARHYTRCCGYNGELNIYPVLFFVWCFKSSEKDRKNRDGTCMQIIFKKLLSILRNFQARIWIPKQSNLSSISFLICELSIIPLS